MLRLDVVLSRLSRRYRNDALGNLSSARRFSCLCLLARTIKWHKLAQWWCHLPVKPVFLNFFEVFLLMMIFAISSKNTPTKISNNWLFSWWERQCPPQVNWPSDRCGFYRLWECSGGNGTSRLMVESATLFQWRWTLWPPSQQHYLPSEPNTSSVSIQAALEHPFYCFFRHETVWSDAAERPNSMAVGIVGMNLFSYY